MSEFSKVTEEVAQLRDNLRESQKQAQGLSVSMGQIIGSIVGADIVGKYLRPMVESMSLVKGLTQGLNAVAKDRFKLEQSIAVAEFRRRSLLQAHTQLNIQGEEEQYRIAILNTRVAQEHLYIQKEFERVGKLRVGALAAIAAFTAAALKINQDINIALVNANATLRSRSKLTFDILQLQMLTGVSHREAAASVAALVNYGFETEASFMRTLRTVTELKEGLDLSVDLSSELAVIVKRQVGGSFEEVANTLARIVEYTTLTANEAGRVAVNISRAISLLRPGIGAAGLSEVIGVVEEYENALKRVGGQAGTVGDFLTRLMSPEGIVGAGALGVQNPEIIATQRGVRDVMRSFSRYAEQALSGLAGYQRGLRLDLLSKQFGMSARQIDELMLAAKTYNQVQNTELTLRERFNQQIGLSGQGIQRLGSAISALMIGGVYPFVVAINFVTSTLALGLEWIGKYRAVLVAAGIATAGLVIYLTGQMWSLAKALATTALMTQTLTNLQREFNVQRAVMLGLATPVPGSKGLQALSFSVIAKGIWSVVTTIATVLMRVAGAILSVPGIIIASFAALGVGLYQYFRLRKQAIDDEKAMRMDIGRASEVIKANSMRNFQIAERYGESDVAERQLQRMARLNYDEVEALGLESKRAIALAVQAGLDALMAEAGTVAKRARYAAVMWTPLAERTAAQRRFDEETLTTQQRIETILQRTSDERGKSAQIAIDDARKAGEREDLRYHPVQYWKEQLNRPRLDPFPIYRN